MSEEELKAEIAKLEGEKAGLVSEITENRTKNRQAIESKETEIAQLKDALAAAVQKNNANPEETKIAEIVTKVLSQEKQGQAERNRKVAFDRFVNAKKEYHPDNDPSGLKRAALERELAGLTAWTTSVEVDDLSTVIGKADAYLRGTDTTRQTQTGTHISSDSSPSSSHVTVLPDNELSSQEAKLIERNGWTKEKYLGLKAKHPDYIASLLA